MSETDARKAIQLAHSHGATRLFRNQVGEAWAGRGYMSTRGLVIPKPYRITFGLAPGSADLIGWRSVRVTPEMVGKRIAVFASVEVKTGRGRYRAGQPEWARQVTDAGGLAGFATDAESAALILGELDES